MTRAGILRFLLLLVFLAAGRLQAADSASESAAQPQPMDNPVCLSCHGNEGFAVPGADGKQRDLHVNAGRFEKSKHGALPCIGCHQDITEIPHKQGVQRKVECGNCHADAAKQYSTSVHAAEVAKGNNAATCVTCHTKHQIQSPKTEAERVAIPERCGACHVENFRSYTDTYHGQVTELGYGYTAKCFDCHSNHNIKRVSDPASTVHPNNRLSTCQRCHTGATAGFLTFHPHANTHDFRRYPQMWIVSKFMIALLIGVFTFFWSHSLLWFYREYKDRKEGKSSPHVAISDLPIARGKQIRRFAPLWRLAHLVFAISVMTLVLTGMAVFYSQTDWARAIMAALGGPRTAAVIHRTAAVTMLSIFFLHLVYVLFFRIIPNAKSFDWFGPYSLVPSWKDLEQAIEMFRWFFGKGPRPSFDKWTYWEKFDYWAVFWGMAIIGGSGLMLWFPNATASVLPGWVFNVATLIHGEEAFLAAVFLFTVHFFNNHFRPDKLPPPDIVMFTGSVPVEEFKREHALEYERLVKSGELQKYLVDAPSRPMTVGSRILGLVLIGFGLTLLVLVITGFIVDMRTG
jgi:cytochrome b subunit of formate dehydrogenase